MIITTKPKIRALEKEPSDLSQRCTLRLKLLSIFNQHYLYDVIRIFISLIKN